VLTESAVIQQYLAETQQNYQLLPEIGAAKRYEVLTWLNYMATEMHKGVGILFNPNIPADVKASVFIPAVHAKLDFIEKHLQHTKAYIAGSEFTLADGYLFTVLTWLPHFNIDITKWPALNTYMNTLYARPSVKLSLTQEGL
jgi:glutathione S-transferase